MSHVTVIKHCSCVSASSLALSGSKIAAACTATSPPQPRTVTYYSIFNFTQRKTTSATSSNKIENRYSFIPPLLFPFFHFPLSCRDFTFYIFFLLLQIPAPICTISQFQNRSLLKFGWLLFPGGSTFDRQFTTREKAKAMKRSGFLPLANNRVGFRLKLDKVSVYLYLMDLGEWCYGSGQTVSLWLICEATVIPSNHWKLIMFAVVIVSQRVMHLSVFMRHVFLVPCFFFSSSIGGIYLQWQVNDASAGACDFSANHVNPSP